MAAAAILFINKFHQHCYYGSVIIVSPTPQTKQNKIINNN